jgi:hypothetical protein
MPAIQVCCLISTEVFEKWGRPGAMPLCRVRAGAPPVGTGVIDPSGEGRSVNRPHPSNHEGEPPGLTCQGNRSTVRTTPFACVGRAPGEGGTSRQPQADACSPSQSIRSFRVAFGPAYWRARPRSRRYHLDGPIPGRHDHLHSRIHEQLVSPYQIGDLGPAEEPDNCVAASVRGRSEVHRLTARSAAGTLFSHPS